MDKKAQRILAGFTCAAFVIVAFFSLLFIAKEAHHAVSYTHLTLPTKLEV